MPAEPDPALQRLLDEEPFVRLLARTLLAEETDEIVQRTWLLALRHGGEEVGAPRSWLARIVRNVTANLRRERQRRERHERDGAAAGGAGIVPSSAELLAREEQRRALVVAVDALPAPLRTVLLLRYFDGLPPRAIAQRLGLPVATVWNQLRRALDVLRERLDADAGGDRRAWALPLVPFAAGVPALPPLPAPAAAAGAVSFGAGVIAMTMKTKLVASLGVLLAAAAAFASWRSNHGASSVSPPPAAGRGPAEVATAATPREPVPEAQEEHVAAREAAPALASTPTTGALLVHVRHGDASPAPGVAVTVAVTGMPPRLGLRATTDAVGMVSFDALEPREWRVYTDRGTPRSSVDVSAGDRARLEVRLPTGLTLTGVVVDRTDVPVAGALVEVAAHHSGDTDAAVLAISGADGRFAVRAAPANCVVGARATGHGASRMKHLFGKEGNAADVRLQLGAPAGAVEGIVVDERNAPIADAAVRIGPGSTTRIHVDGESAPPIPALVRSDAEGRFRAVGVLPGTQPVHAHAADRAPWTGSVQVVADLVTPLRIEMVPGARLRGVVRSGDGAAVDRAMVVIDDPADFATSRTSTAPDGTFVLAALPHGEQRVVATHGAHGHAERTVALAAAAETTCELRLARGVVVRGVVVDENGTPVANAMVQCWPSEPLLEVKAARSGADGSFEVVDCPSGGPLRLLVRAQGFDGAMLPAVDPSTGVRVTLRRLLPPSARITGVVVDVDGKPVANARVGAFGRNAAASGRGFEASGPDGRFACGPLAPGTFTVRIDSGDHAPFRSEPFELAADAVRDLGRIVLSTGGRVRVRVEGDPDGVQLTLLDAQDRNAVALRAGGDPRTSTSLAPGDYWLRVGGDRCAAQSLPVSVRAGEITAVTVSATPGVRQRVAIAPTPAVPPSSWVRVTVTRGEQRLAVKALQPSAERAGEVAFSLAPGSYTLRATAEQRELARATFTVGEQEGPPVQLTLR